MNLDTVKDDLDKAINKGKGLDSLGPAYFVARDFSEKLFECDFEKSDELLVKPIEKFAKDFYGQLLELAQNHLINDARMNIHNYIYRVVDYTVEAMVGGEKWALQRYVFGKYHQHEKVRETLCSLIPKEIQDGRVADLEKKIAELETENQRLRSRL